MMWVIINLQKAYLERTQQIRPVDRQPTQLQVKSLCVQIFALTFPLIDEPVDLVLTVCRLLLDFAYCYARVSQTPTYSGVMPTPTLDQLASEGTKLEMYYVQPLCSPTVGQICKSYFVLFRNYVTMARWKSTPYVERARHTKQ